MFEAITRFELVYSVLQTDTLPLGHITMFVETVGIEPTSMDFQSTA